MGVWGRELEASGPAPKRVAAGTNEVMCTSRCSSSRNLEPGVDHSQHVETYQVWCPRNPPWTSNYFQQCKYFLAVHPCLVVNIRLEWVAAIQNPRRESTGPNEAAARDARFAASVANIRHQE